MNRAEVQEAIRSARELWERNHAVVVDNVRIWFDDWFQQKHLDIDQTKFVARDEDWTAFGERKDELLRLLRGPELLPLYQQLAARRDWPELASEAKPWHFGGPLSSTEEYCRLRNRHEIMVKEGDLPLEVAMETIITPLRDNARHWRRLFDRAEGRLKGEATRNSARSTVKKKRSTQKGDAQGKLIGALLLHHGYERPGDLKKEPIGTRELSRLAIVAGSSASVFIKKTFGGRSDYIRVCKDHTKLLANLKRLNQDYASRRHLRGQHGIEPIEPEESDE